jgi:hypothetical protein
VSVATDADLAFLKSLQGADNEQRGKPSPPPTCLLDIALARAAPAEHQGSHP